MEKFGVENLKEVLNAGIALGVGLDKSLSDDGKITWMEYFNFTGVITKLPAAINDIGLVPKEVKDLDAEEKQEIVDFVADKLDLEDDNLEAQVEKIFEDIMNTFIAILTLTSTIQGMRKSGSNE